jgi:O-antigen/teichoic acid export membrane protein
MAVLSRLGANTTAERDGQRNPYCTEIHEHPRRNSIGIFRIIKNSSLVLIARTTDVVSSILIAGMLARYLGVGDYGNYLFIMGVVLTTTAFAHMGLPQILVREMSRNTEAMPRLIRCGLILTGGSLILTFAVVGSVGIFSDWDGVMLTALFAALCSESLVLMSGPFLSAFISLERMVYDALVTVVSRLVLIGLLMGILLWNLGFLSIFLAMGVANSLRLAVILLIATRLNIVAPRRVSRPDLSYLLKETLPVGISFILTQLYLYTNLFILKILRNPEEVALFQAPFSIILKLQILPVVLIVAFAPVMARLAAAGEPYNHLKTVYLWLVKHIFIVCLPLSVLGLLLAKDITVVVFGKDFSAAGLSFQILIWIVGFYFLNIFSDKILQVIFRQRLLIVSSAIAFSINVLLSFILISRYGYMGGSIAVLISSAVLFLSNFFFVSRQLSGVSLAFMIKPLGVFAAVLGGAYLLSGTRIPMMVLFIAGTLVYTALLILLKGLSKSEIKNFLIALNEKE